MNPSEPTPQDVSAVAQAVGIPDTVPEPTQPAPQQQPPTPTPQPAPTQQPAAQPDAFQQLAGEQPSEPTAQTPPAAPAQPTEPTTPQPTEPTSQQTTPQPQQPAETQPTPTQPQAQPQQQPAQEPPKTQTFDEYMESVLGDLPPAPTAPDPSKVNPEDEESVGNFFKDLMETAKQEFKQEYARDQAIQNSERKLWDDAFDKYGSLRGNKQLRDMVHAIRMNEFNKGIAITPTQAADRLLDAMKGQYNKGVADNQVQTTIEQVQPQGGGSTDVPTTQGQQQVLESVQTGGETALVDILNKEIQAGRL